MTLPPVPSKKDKTNSGPTMLDKNREIEARQEAEAALVLTPEERVATGKLTVSPISLHVLDGFEDIYIKLRKQRRSLKRYQVAEALLIALVEDADVLAAVVKRIN